jgi:hypothetical protein
MKRNLASISVFSLFLFFMTSCGTTVSVTNDFDKTIDFSKYKSFSFYHLKTTGDISQLNADRIKNAIVLEMQGKGYVEDKDNPDLLINAVTVLQEKEATAVSSTNYYGYGGFYRPYGYGYGYGYPLGNSTSVNTYNYKDGTLMIDVLDTKTDKLIWEGTGTSEITSKVNDPEKAIGYAVSKILASYPASVK